MTALTFAHADLKGLLIHAMHQWPLGLRPLHGEPAPKPGFWIVGDEGVYLMHNGQTHEGFEKQPVVYAVECNPEADDWWEVKRATFGGDDGADFIEAKTIKDVIALGHDMIVKFTKDQMLIESARAK